MDTCEKLYRLAKRRNIEVVSYPLEAAEALSVPIDGMCAIAIDPDKLRSKADETVKLAHELGHCARGAFYSAQTPLETRGRCECRANTWAIKRLVPFSSLLHAVHNHITEPWELAEHFGVTEDFLRLAIEYYTERQGFRLE